MKRTTYLRLLVVLIVFLGARAWEQGLGCHCLQHLGTLLSTNRKSAWSPEWYFHQQAAQWPLVLQIRIARHLHQRQALRCFCRCCCFQLISPCARALAVYLHHRLALQAECFHLPIHILSTPPRALETLGASTPGPHHVELTLPTIPAGHAASSSAGPPRQRRI